MIAGWNGSFTHSFPYGRARHGGSNGVSLLRALWGGESGLARALNALQTSRIAPVSQGGALHLESVQEAKGRHVACFVRQGERVAALSQSARAMPSPHNFMEV